MTPAVSPVIAAETDCEVFPETELGLAFTVVTVPVKFASVPYLKTTVDADPFGFTEPLSVAVVPTPTFVAALVATDGEFADAAVKL